MYKGLYTVLCAARWSGWIWQLPFWILAFACTVALNCQKNSQNVCHGCKKSNRNRIWSKFFYEIFFTMLKQLFTPCLDFIFLFSQQLVIVFLLNIYTKSRNAQTFWHTRPLSVLAWCHFQSHNALRKHLSSTSIGINWKCSLRCARYMPVEMHC